MNILKLFKKKMAEVVIIYKQGHAVPKNVTKLIFDASVIEIPFGAFIKCEHLKEVMLNEGLQKIGVWAFGGCKSLAIIKLPSTVTEVGESAFYECTNLREVILNDGLQKIWTYAFAGCSSLTVITLPSTVSEVGSRAFLNCTHLRKVIFDEGLPTIEEAAFDECASLAVVKFPNISKRIRNLIEVGQTDVEDKVTVNQHFQWRGGELLVSPEAIHSANLTATRTNIEQVLAWISHYELKEATTLYELALWKAKIEEMEAATHEERSECRVDVPGFAKDAIFKYLQQSDPTDDE